MNSQVSNFLASHPYSDATKSTYAYILDDLVKQNIEKWGAGDLLNFVKRENWGNSMRYVALCACRSFIIAQHGSNHPALTARLKRCKPKPQRSLKFNQVLDLLAMFDTYTPIGARDQCLAAIALDTGLRVSELASIKLANIDIEHRSILVMVKGGQWQYAVYSPETAAILDRWLSYRKPADGVNALFLSLAKNARHSHALTVNGIKTAFKKWGKLLNIKLSPHDARRTFATVSTIMGAPSRVVQVAGRWSDIAMVERYTRAIEADAIQPYLPIHNALKPKS